MLLGELRSLINEMQMLLEEIQFFVRRNTHVVFTV